MPSWAVILKPNEAFFCPIVPTPSSPKLDLSSINQVLELLGGELAEAIARDPQIHASIWYNKRIDIRWSQNRPDFLEKIQACLHRNRILAHAFQGDKAELIAHQLSEDVYALYKYNIRLTGSILDYLAENVLQDKRCLGHIHSLMHHGFSEEEIGALAEKHIVKEATFLIEQFHCAGVSYPKEYVQKLMQNRIHFHEVHQAISALQSGCFRFTAKLCEELTARPGFGAQLAWASTLTRPIQNIGDLFAGSPSQVHGVIWIIQRLPNRPHFESNIYLLNRNKNRALEIQNTLIAMNQAGIYPTSNFYSLLFKLINTLYPIDLDVLKSLATHSDAIEDALEGFQYANFELTKDQLLFLIAEGERARGIGEHASAIARLLRGTVRANIQLEPEDVLLAMTHAKYADPICSTIYYLDESKIPLTRNDFLLLIENRDLAEKLSLILKTLRHEFIWINREDFFRLLETGGSDETIRMIKDNFLAKKCVHQPALLSRKF